MDAEFGSDRHPDVRAVSRGLVTTVTAQKMTPYVRLVGSAVREAEELDVEPRRVQGAPRQFLDRPTVTLSPLRGTTVNWPGKYSVANALRT